MDGHAGVLALLLLRVSAGPGHRHGDTRSALLFSRSSVAAALLGSTGAATSFALVDALRFRRFRFQSMASCNFAARLSLIMLPTY